MIWRAYKFLCLCYCVWDDEGSCTHIGCSGSNGFILVVNRNRLFLFEFKIISRRLRFKVKHCLTRSRKKWPGLSEVSRFFITGLERFDWFHLWLRKSQYMAIEVLSFSAGIKSRNNVDRLHQIFMNLHVHSVAIWTYSDATQYCLFHAKVFWIRPIVCCISKMSSKSSMKFIIHDTITTTIWWRGCHRTFTTRCMKFSPQIRSSASHFWQPYKGLQREKWDQENVGVKTLNEDFRWRSDSSSASSPAKTGDTNGFS